MRFLIDKASKHRGGVYAIRNTVNDLVYVGATANFGVRFSVHLSQLTKGIHHNKALQCAVSEAGLGAFSFEALEVVEEDSKELRRMEQRWLDHYSAVVPDLVLNSKLTSYIKVNGLVKEGDVLPAFTLRLSAEAQTKLEELAKAQRRSKTAVIEVLILESATRERAT